MSRTGVDVVIAAGPLPGAATSLDPPLLLDALWKRWLRIHMGNRVRRAPYTPIFSGGYIDSQAAGALAVGAWRYADGALRLRFDDSLGTARVHAIASAHFTTLSLALLTLDQNFVLGMRHEGWLIAPHPDPRAVMDDVDTPLIELRGALYVIQGPASSPSLISPHPTQTLTVEMLTTEERAAVTDAITRRACQCQLCEYYRPRVEKLMATAAKRAAKTGKTATST
jgi:hypothetical protein